MKAFLKILTPDYQLTFTPGRGPIYGGDCATFVSLCECGEEVSFRISTEHLADMLKDWERSKKWQAQQRENGRQPLGDMDICDETRDV